MEKGSLIKRQIVLLIEARLHLENDNGQPKKRTINYHLEVDELSKAGKKIEQLTFKLLKRYEKNPQMASWFIDLLTSAEYYFKQIWKLNKFRPAPKDPEAAMKYYYYFRCQYYLYTYKCFLRQQVYGQNIFHERVLQQAQLPLPANNGVKKTKNSTAMLPNEPGNKIQIPEGYVKKDPYKVSIPKGMALLNELDIRHHPKILALPHKNQVEIFQRVLGGSYRYVEANHSVLDEFSNEDRSRNTAHKHKEWAKSLFIKKSS